MRNDLLNRRLLKSLPYFDLGEELADRSFGGESYPVPSNNAPLLFDLPLNANTESALIDKVGGNRLELNPNLSSYSATFSWDESMQMYKFYTGNLPTVSSSGWIARVKVNLPGIIQNTAEHCAFGKMSTESSSYSDRYAFAASPGVPVTHAGLCIRPISGSTSLSGYKRKPNYEYYFWSVKSDSRCAVVVNKDNTVSGASFSSDSTEVIGNWYENDYIYFGPICESKLQYVTFYLSNYRIYNKFVTQNDIMIGQAGEAHTVGEDLATGTCNVTRFVITAEDCACSKTSTKVNYDIEYTVEYDGTTYTRSLLGQVDSPQFPINDTQEGIVRKIRMLFGSNLATTTFTHNPPINTNNYMTIEALEDGLTATLTRTATQYCVDGSGEWVSLSAGSTTPAINAGQTISFKATNPSIASSYGIGTFTISKQCNLKGNCMSLLFGDDATTSADLSGKSYAFYLLFKSCTTIKKVDEGFLPATVLANYCYGYMFNGCSSLVQAPELPATTLVNYCYYYMFNGCSKLNYIKMMATDISASNCLYHWVDGVASIGDFVKNQDATWGTMGPSGVPYGWIIIAKIQELVPTTSFSPGICLEFVVEESGYFGFEKIAYCQQIYVSVDKENWKLVTTKTVFEVQPGDIYYVCGSKTSGGFSTSNYTQFIITHNMSCIGNINSLLDYTSQNTTLYDYCYYRMFYGCSKLTQAPELPATTLERSCYHGMFLGCSSLIQAPELPATTLATQCYDSMFLSCTSLTQAPELPATTLAFQCYQYMFLSCTSLTQAPELPATTLEEGCYYRMFYGCTSLTQAPELPTTTLETSCYYLMFYGCTSLTQAPELPATTLVSYCYYGMFLGCSSLTQAPELPATVLSGYCYSGMFLGCSSLVQAPELPVTTLASRCYLAMFLDCTSLIQAPELPATVLVDYCYSDMFLGCTSLTQAPELPATTLANYCYLYMFLGCTSLTQAPELPATVLANYCYLYMFYGCSKLNYIKMLATDISASNCLYNWVSGVASTGAFVKNVKMNSLPSGVSGIPSGWTVVDDYTPQECLSLSITADDVSGRETNTTIYWEALTNGVNSNGEPMLVTLTGTAISEDFEQNTSETETIERTIAFEYMGVTVTTTITQGVWISSYYEVVLNNQWELSSTISNPDISTYDGVYQSFSNKGTHNSGAIMYIDITGYENFKLYIRSYAESNYDYVMVSQLDLTVYYNTLYSDSSLIKAHTRGNQQSGTAIGNYTLVEFTGIDGGEHRITIVYRKDSSSNYGDDRGYVLILKNQ